MILNEMPGFVSPIALSVLLIVFLMFMEFGSERVRKIVLPLVIALGITFSIVFIQDILSKW